jgi:hypothetical protein
LDDSFGIFSFFEIPKNFRIILLIFFFVGLGLFFSSLFLDDEDEVEEEEDFISHSGTSRVYIYECV